MGLGRHTTQSGQAGLMDIFTPQPASYLRELDPRVRVACTFAFALAVTFLSHLPSLIIALATGALLTHLSRKPWKRILKRTAVLNLFLLLLGLSLAVSIPGEILYLVGPFMLSREGLTLGLVILLRANAILLTVTALLGSMEPPNLGFALYRLGVPASFTHILLFMIRYIEVIHVEYHRLRDAMQTRAFEPATNLHTFRSFGYLIGLLLVRSLDRSNRVLAAMKCRGFYGRYHVMQTLTWERRDTSFTVAAILVVLVMIVLEIM